MRASFRINFRNFTSYFMLSRTQTLEGMTSLQPDGKHIVMFDLDDCNLEEALHELKRVQNEHSLADIFVYSDKIGSYRVVCWNHISFWEYMNILTSLPESMVDYDFFWWTANRGKATLRTINKHDRPPQKLVAVLESYPHPEPEIVQKVDYDTGVEKLGINISLDVLTDEHVFRVKFQSPRKTHKFQLGR